MKYINNLIYIKYEKPTIYGQVDFINLGCNSATLSVKDQEKLVDEIRKVIGKYNKKLISI